MQLLNLNIQRVIIHQVFRRDADGNKVVPTQSYEYTNFDQNAMNAFKRRVNDALGDGSSAVQMDIVHQEAGSLPSLIDTMIDQDKETFAGSSYDIATKLADSQQTKSIPGGIVVVFSGYQGPNRTKFLGIIKAEVHSGYEKETNPQTGEISLSFIEELLLTPASRLYKTAGFFEKANRVQNSDNLNNSWAVMVSDAQINKAGGKAAAQYFYADFLGCGYPQTSARTTKQFYEATTDFITQLDVTASKKNDLMNALVTYLKVDNSNSISAAGFAETYFDDVDIQDSFTSHIREVGLPNVAFTKDLEHIESNLKYRKVSFQNNIKVSAPSDVFRRLVVISAIEGDLDESGNPAEWTQIIVKDKISNQE